MDDENFEKEVSKMNGYNQAMFMGYRLKKHMWNNTGLSLETQLTMMEMFKWEDLKEFKKTLDKAND